MMNKKAKAGGACALALALVLAGLKLSGVYAALPVDTTRKCSIEFSLAENVYHETEESGEGAQSEDPALDFEELQDLDIIVKLYKVADMIETGAYKAAEGFEGLGLDKINDKTAASEWAAKAAQARGLLSEETKPDAEVTMNEGTGTASGLSVGMYLVVVDEVKSPYFTYNFNEYLVSLPNNYYYENQSDEWIYELTGEHAAGLKPNRTERLGDLIIHKTLTSFNASVGGATFVFEVKVQKLGEDEVSATNVYKLEFNEPGRESLIIEDLPAGASVTVTEIYTGASYELVSEAEQTAEIIAKDPEKETDPAAVSFSNQYDRRQNGGSGIVNCFYKDGKTVKCDNGLQGEE